MPISGEGISAFLRRLGIQDEGIDITDNATCLNFIGAEVEAKIGENGKVNIYIPTPGYSSNFNTSNGNTDATVDLVTTEQRKISTPGAFNIGDWVAGSVQDCLNNSNIVYSTNGSFSLLDETTSIVVNVLDADGLTVLSSNTVSDINADIASDLNNIEITISNFQIDTDQFKCELSVNIDISAILPNGGRFSVEIIHNNSTNGIYTFNQNNMFYDTDSIQASISSTAISEVTPVIKNISGVKYYTTGSTFNITLSGINNINYISYPINFININSSNYGIDNYQLSSGDLTGWSNNFDNINASYSSTVAINSFQYLFVGGANISSNTIDWTNGAPVSSHNDNILVDTYGILSNETSEYFVDEAKRLTNLLTSFDSTLLLGNDELLINDGKLKRRIGDFSTYKPLNTANYIDVSDTQCYYTYFKHVNTSHSNGIFNIIGVTEQNLVDSDINIEISLNGTDWYSLNNDYLGGVLNNGDGCRIDKTIHSLDSNNQIRFTLGTGKFTDLGTGFDDYGIFVKLCMPQFSTVEVESILITDWS